MDIHLAHEGVFSPEGGSAEAFSDLSAAMGISAAPPDAGGQIKVGRLGRPGGATIAPSSGADMPGHVRAAIKSAGSRLAQPTARRQIPDDYVPGVSPAPTITEEAPWGDSALPANYGRQAELKAQALLQKTGQAEPAPAPPKEAPPAEQPKTWHDYFDEAAPQKMEFPVKTAQPVDEQHVDRRRILMEASPVELGKIMIRVFRQHWLEWEPETLWAEIGNWAGFVVPQPIRDKVFAVRIILGTTRFHNEWPVFENVAIALNGRTPIPQVHQYLSPEEIARAISWSKQIEAREFSAEVLAYIGAVCFEEGVLCLPDPMRDAQPFLDKLVKDDSICPTVWEAWNKIKSKITPHDVQGLDLGGDGPVAIQIARMASIAIAGRHPDLRLSDLQPAAAS